MDLITIIAITKVVVISFTIMYFLVDELTEYIKEKKRINKIKEWYIKYKN